uniref:Uncharacterized protein n=1 Tax=Arundo donax TaxID=35708 RepID=A0A0A9FX23_ARUDO
MLPLDQTVAVYLFGERRTGNLLER